MNLNIKGKWALITGASRGVGQQIAIGLAQCGVNLVLHSRAIANQKETLDKLQDYAIQVESVDGDLLDLDDVQHFCLKAEQLSGGIDIVYNNAALMTNETPLFNTPVQDYEKSFQVNVISMIQICHFFAPKMKSKGYGRIINVTSGIKDTPKLDAYSISKAAVDKYTRDLAVELAETGVLANMLDPGWCRTDLGGENAFNDVRSVLPGALVPALLANSSFEAPKGQLFAAQDYAGIEFPSLK